MDDSARQPEITPPPTGPACLRCGAPANGTCPGCGRFYCPAHRPSHFYGVCSSCYNGFRVGFGAVGLLFVGIVGFVANIAQTSNFSRAEDRRFFLTAWWLIAFLLGACS